MKKLKWPKKITKRHLFFGLHKKATRKVDTARTCTFLLWQKIQIWLSNDAMWYTCHSTAKIHAWSKLLTKSIFLVSYKRGRFLVWQLISRAIWLCIVDDRSECIHKYIYVHVLFICVHVYVIKHVHACIYI